MEARPESASRQLSFEFFPPKTPEGVAKLRATRAQLAQLKPAFFSVTYGAGGSTREGTLGTVLEMIGGDLPSGTADAGEFRYASDLVAFIRAQTGAWFHIDVAAYPEYHPQSRTPQDDLAAFRRKIDAEIE